MKNKYLLLSILLVLASLGATLALYGSLPESIPTHWNARGEADHYGSPVRALVIPGAMAALVALFAVLPRVSPKRFSVDAFSPTYWFCVLIIVAMMGYMQAVVLLAVTGHDVDIPRALGGGIAVFSALLGNVMGKVKRNFWIGVRTPWTLANERVWYATHRLAAKSMVATSVLAFVAAVAGVPLAAIALIVSGTVFPAVWSLVYYKRLERGGGLEA